MIEPRMVRVRTEAVLEQEVRRRVVLEQTRALRRALTGLRSERVQAAALGRRRPSRLSVRRTRAGRQHGLALRDASAFSRAAEEYARTAPWLERARRAARRRREWWLRRFRSWDLPERRRRWVIRDRLMAGAGIALLAAGCVLMTWWIHGDGGRLEPAAEERRPGLALHARDLAAAKMEAERTALAFLRARDSRERAIYVRRGPGGSRPAQLLQQRGWNDGRIVEHWAEPLARGLMGHWLRLMEEGGPGDRWVAIVTRPASVGMGWSAQVDGEAMRAYETSAWTAFLNGPDGRGRQTFRVLAGRDPFPVAEAAPDGLILRLSDVKRERFCRVFLARDHPDYGRWRTGELVHGGTGRDRPFTLVLEKAPGEEAENQLGLEPRDIRLVSILADGWILP